MATVKDLKTTLVNNKATWTVQGHLLDHMELPKFRTGGLKDKLILSTEVKAIDFKKLFAVPSNNPFILERRIAHGIVPSKLVAKELHIGSAQELTLGVGALVAGGGAPASIDWRNRWGWPWITTIRDQDGCEACWCFAAVALVEAMVRIEHCVWHGSQKAMSTKVWVVIVAIVAIRALLWIG